MALIVITENHDALVRKIEYAIDAEVVEDWSYAGGRDFVFTGDLAKVSGSDRRSMAMQACSGSFRRQVAR